VRRAGEWIEALQGLVTGLLFLILFALGCYVGLATSWPALQAALTPEAQFLTRTAGVLLGAAAAALLYRWLQAVQSSREARRLEDLLQGLLQASDAAEERALRIASQKALLLNLQITDRLDHVRRSLIEECDRLEAENRELRASLEPLLRRLRERADPGTKPADSAGFEKRLAECLARRGGAGPVCLILAAVDDLAAVQASYGRASAQTVLQGIAAILRRPLPSEDLLARVREDEFALIWKDASEAEARRCAERLRHEIDEANWRVGAVVIRVTASFGVAEARPAEEPSELQARARQALDLAKKSGRNRVSSFSDAAKA
jgi:diguanylate cyclase (GGDEF)-like protein